MNILAGQLNERTVDGAAVILLIDRSYAPAPARTFGVDRRGTSLVITVTCEEKAIALLQTAAVDILISDVRDGQSGFPRTLREHATRLQPNIRLVVPFENGRRYPDRARRRSPNAFLKNGATIASGPPPCP